MSPSTPRADAVRSRARILASARELVDAPGGLRLSAVGRAAGVGQATVYRHFPTVEALLTELYRVEVGELADAAHDLLGRHPALEALRLWLTHLTRYARTKRGVLAALGGSLAEPVAGETAALVREAVDALLTAGQADGSLRADVDAVDVIAMIGFLSRVGEPEVADRAEHLLVLVLDGLRTRPQGG
ncbi:TetR/AcrR family transcriptional regulator [Auraticoccus monumenti]|uniref:DNA-binding transcriptional regulator, AcrR family n=1 Tax=Auraticoccus monumenti TaxID=675864 RepID=A0A1G6RKN4_9ACTN|nr:TetR/AcrR family transcriptional regulator [Auraticoccus monumenti]SDD05192.1 DNA-binding transcriptional regulator, AcrR family [Auraticoccus monumenti]